MSSNTTEEALAAWLAGDGAERRVVAFVEAFWSEAADMPLERLVPGDELETLLQGYLTPAFLSALVAPWVGPVAGAILRQWAEMDRRWVDVIGDANAEAWLAWSRREDVVPEALVRSVLSDPVVEDIMRGVLVEAVRGFNQRANPFTADWGLPALVDALPRVGRGPVKAAMEGMRREFEKRFEPELERFVVTFGRKSLDRLATRMVDDAGEPQMKELRAQVTAAVLRTSTADLVWDPRLAEAGRELQACIAGAVGSVLADAAVASWWRRTLLETWGAHADLTLRQIAQKLGLKSLDVAPLVRASWPLWRVIIGTDTVLQGLSRMVEDAQGLR
ncbi:MAG: hypothetical protein AAGA56_28570 [Myxococcota bacterium]